MQEATKIGLAAAVRELEDNGFTVTGVDGDLFYTATQKGCAYYILLSVCKCVGYSFVDGINICPMRTYFPPKGVQNPMWYFDLLTKDFRTPNVYCIDDAIRTVNLILD